MSAADAPDVAVIVASFNVSPLLRECLGSLGGALEGLRAEIWVVDNNSVDDSAEMVRTEFPGVHLIVNRRNMGFARANNQALKKARGRYLLLLNPDTFVPPGTIAPMVAYLDAHPEAGMAGPRLVRPDGRMDEACRRSFPTPLSALSRFMGLDRVFPRSRLFGSYRRTYESPEDSCEVDSVVGAFMLLRRAALDDVGGLDEDYFMFGEDLDWCYRLKSRRWKVVYLGAYRAIHHKGASSASAPFLVNYHFHRSMVLFHKKHLTSNYPFFVNWAVYGGISLRYALKSVLMVLAGWRRPPSRAAAGGDGRKGGAAPSPGAHPQDRVAEEGAAP